MFLCVTVWTDWCEVRSIQYPDLIVETRIQRCNTGWVCVEKRLVQRSGSGEDVVIKDWSPETSIYVKDNGSGVNLLW